MNETKMLCPCCRKELIKGKQCRLETLDDHVTDPNGNGHMRATYVCPDETCATRLWDIFWDFEGSLYCKKYISCFEMDKIHFIDNNNAPFGTFQRQMNIEIYKKDENKTLVTLPKWFPSVLGGMKIRSEYSYTSNENGDILKRRLHFQYIRKDGVIHMWGIGMLKYSLRSIYREWKDLRIDPNYKFARKHLEEYVQRKDWVNAEWWRKVSGKVASLALKTVPLSVYQTVDVNKLNAKV